MSVLVVGVSHRTAPVELLERLAFDGDDARKLSLDVLATEHVEESVLLATCNRLEVYTEVDRFHGSVEAVTALLAERSGLSTEALIPHLYIHYDDGAVSHLFEVAAGLDSMVVGEGQILGQTREALGSAQGDQTAGPALNMLFQQALRVGKRAHAETDIDRAAPSLVTAALERCLAETGPITDRTALIVGAGAMARLAVVTLGRLGVAEIVVVNRSAGNAERLAAEFRAAGGADGADGADGAEGATLRVRSASFERLPTELRRTDLVVSCTGSPGVIIPADLVAERADAARPLGVIDLALPHDVDPAVADQPGVTLVDLRLLADELDEHAGGQHVCEVRAIVDQEIAAFGSARRQASVTPTVIALRSMATGVADAEIERLFARLPDLPATVRAEVEHTVRRVTDKLVHQPTVRVKELANTSGAVSYAEALAELFALEPGAVEAVTSPVDREAP